jgi:hypothetical protein
MGVFWVNQGQGRSQHLMVVGDITVAMVFFTAMFAMNLMRGEITSAIY